MFPNFCLCLSLHLHPLPLPSLCKHLLFGFSRKGSKNTLKIQFAVAFSINKLISFRWEQRSEPFSSTRQSFSPTKRDFDGRTASRNVIDGSLVLGWINSSSASCLRARTPRALGVITASANCIEVYQVSSRRETLSAESYTKPIRHQMHCN
jgi:hypothetical protein